MTTNRDAGNEEIALWRRLVVVALRSGVRYEDAQDLASQAILQGLKSHDASRSPFAAFCHTIHANLLKNTWRDRKTTVEFDPEIDQRPDPRDHRDRLVLEEIREMMSKIAEKILAELTPEEAALFLTLAELYDSAERAAVSEAARRLGIEPLRGWDIFRRIQRKARHLSDEFAEGGRDVGLRRASEYIPESGPVMSEPPPPPRAARSPARSRQPILLAAACATAGYDRFAERLSPEQRAHLARLLS
ncbi:MAG: RNA polymerase sigma factor [bacterium]